ncbi:Chitin bind 4 domain containing protein [Babesia ovata]|uniref:Chitin bind 4 domain containing protein n=1 Tax=Babesia ovata TaxID=189622 RepID=A0A2H6KG36_9APIC|nr:Chitin bind 4 domain containing protein [Babesia ovata]GBE61955.1 Chitin bind 4 domain containing protein [Babesia ovata]
MKILITIFRLRANCHVLSPNSSATPIKESYIDPKAKDVTEAILDCIPKFLAALYFLLYNVDYRFEAVGGAKWQDDYPGWELDRRDFWGRTGWGGELQRYLRMSLSVKYGDLIAGGFSENEVTYGYEYDSRYGYQYGKDMIPDLKNILDKHSHKYNDFRDVFFTTVISKSGLQKSNTANVLALVKTFCEIVQQNPDGGSLKAVLEKELEGKCVNWSNLVAHCKTLEQQLGKLFNIEGFSFTGQARRVDELNTERFAGETAIWFRQHLHEVQKNVEQIDTNFPVDDTLHLNVLQQFATENLFPYGFIFGDQSYGTLGDAWKKLSDHWPSVIDMLGKNGGGLAELKRILDGGRCRPPAPPPKPRSRPAPAPRPPRPARPVPPHQPSRTPAGRTTGPRNVGGWSSVGSQGSGARGVGGHNRRSMIQVRGGGQNSGKARGTTRNGRHHSGPRGASGARGAQRSSVPGHTGSTKPQPLQSQNDSQRHSQQPPLVASSAPGDPAIPIQPGGPGPISTDSVTPGTRTTSSPQDVLTQTPSVSGSNTGSDGVQGTGQHGGGGAGPPGGGHSVGQTQTPSNNVKKCDGVSMSMNGKSVCYRQPTIPKPTRPSTLYLPSDVEEKIKKADVAYRKKEEEDRRQAEEAWERRRQQMYDQYDSEMRQMQQAQLLSVEGFNVSDAMDGNALPDVSALVAQKQKEAEERSIRRNIQFLQTIQDDINNNPNSNDADSVFMSGTPISEPAALVGRPVKQTPNHGQAETDAHKQLQPNSSIVVGDKVLPTRKRAKPLLPVPPVGVPMGHPIEPTKPAQPLPKPQPKKIRPTFHDTPKNIVLPKYKHPLKSHPVTTRSIPTAHIDDNYLSKMLEVAGDEVTSSPISIPAAEVPEDPRLKRFPTVPLEGEPIADRNAQSVSMPPVELEPAPPPLPIELDIKKTYYPELLYQNDERRSVPLPSVALPPAMPDDMYLGVPPDGPHLPTIQDIAVFADPYQCRNPWYVPDSSTDLTPSPASPPPNTDQLPPPKTVREMLHWMVGLNQKGYVGIIKEHIEDLLREYSKDVSRTLDALDITGKPYTLEASHVAGTLTEACLYSANVLHKIKHKDNSKAVSVPDFSSEYSKLYYASDPACLLCQLRDYVYACCHQLAFLKSQCSRDQSHGGWQACEYGLHVSVSNSPLQAFLTDDPSSKFETHPFDPCDICRKSRVMMGFEEKDSPEKSQTGNHLYNILTPSCGGEDPLLTLSSHLTCLTSRTPRTTGELVSFFHNFGNSLYKPHPHLSQLGSALSEPHRHCPDWDHLAADDLNAIQYIRGPAPPTSNHDKDHPKTLSAIIGCGIDNVDCPQLMKTITYRAYALYSPTFAHTYLSWAVYLADRLWDSLLKLHYDLENLQCHDSKSKPLHQCTKALPLLYSHGITPPDGTVQSSLTCSAAVTKLGDVVAGKPIASLMTAMDEFLHRVREPFLYTVFTVWLIATLYIAHSLLYRMDVLHIRSHLFTTRASHLIDVKALLTKGRKMLSLYKDVDYFDDDVHS